MTANQTTDPLHESAFLQDNHTLAQRSPVPLTMPVYRELDLSRMPNEPFMRHRVNEGENLEQVTFASPPISNIGLIGHAIRALSNSEQQQKK